MSRTLGTAALRRWMALFGESLERHQEEIDSLNVFPVADGDTGTNLFLTVQATTNRLAEVNEGAPWHDVAQAILTGSLLGARGNSGVILSQVLRGLLAALPEEGAGPGDVARALVAGSEEADRAVAAPADGTMLSVLRDAARGAARAAGSTQDLDAVLDAALSAARLSLARTPDLLPELRRAGVVDAGGRGMVLLFDAFRAAVTNGVLTEPIGPPGPVGRSEARSGYPVEGPATEVQLVLEADGQAVAALRSELTGLGESVVVVGGGDLYSVHVHTDDPDAAVAAASAAGRPREVSVVALVDRWDHCLAGQARGVRVAEQTTGLVAVAEGEGLVRTFRSLGAVVVGGGPGHTPAVAELTAAVEAAPGEEVVILPNHPHVVAAAAAAGSAASKRVHVIPARSIPAGLAAAAAFNPGATLEDNAAEMEGAVTATASAEVTPVNGASAAEAVGEVVTKLAAGGGELVTIIVGAEADPGDTERVVARVRREHPQLEVSVVAGGQPHRPYLIGLE